MARRRSSKLKLSNSASNSTMTISRYIRSLMEQLQHHPPPPPPHPDSRSSSETRVHYYQPASHFMQNTPIFSSPPSPPPLACDTTTMEPSLLSTPSSLPAAADQLHFHQFHSIITPASTSSMESGKPTNFYVGSLHDAADPLYPHRHADPIVDPCTSVDDTQGGAACMTYNAKPASSFRGATAKLAAGAAQKKKLASCNTSRNSSDKLKLKNIKKKKQKNGGSGAKTISSGQQVWLMIVERMREEILKARDVHRADLHLKSLLSAPATTGNNLQVDDGTRAQKRRDGSSSTDISNPVQTGNQTITKMMALQNPAMNSDSFYMTTDRDYNSNQEGEGKDEADAPMDCEEEGGVRHYCTVCARNNKADNEVAAGRGRTQDCVADDDDGGHQKIKNDDQDGVLDKKGKKKDGKMVPGRRTLAAAAAVAVTVCGHYLCWRCLCQWHQHKLPVTTYNNSAYNPCTEEDEHTIKNGQLHVKAAKINAVSSLSSASSGSGGGSGANNKKECPCCHKVLAKSQVTFLGHHYNSMEDQGRRFTAMQATLGHVNPLPSSSRINDDHDEIMEEESLQEAADPQCNATKKRRMLSSGSSSSSSSSSSSIHSSICCMDHREKLLEAAALPVLMSINAINNNGRYNILPATVDAASYPIYHTPSENIAGPYIREQHVFSHMQLDAADCSGRSRQQPNYGNINSDSSNHEDKVSTPADSPAALTPIWLPHSHHPHERHIPNPNLNPSSNVDCNAAGSVYSTTSNNYTSATIIVTDSEIPDLQPAAHDDDIVTEPVPNLANSLAPTSSTANFNGPAAKMITCSSTRPDVLLDGLAAGTVSMISCCSCTSRYYCNAHSTYTCRHFMSVSPDSYVDAGSNCWANMDHQPANPFSASSDDDDGDGDAGEFFNSSYINPPPHYNSISSGSLLINNEATSMGTNSTVHHHERNYLPLYDDLHEGTAAAVGSLASLIGSLNHQADVLNDDQYSESANTYGTNPACIQINNAIQYVTDFNYNNIQTASTSADNFDRSMPRSRPFILSNVNIDNIDHHEGAVVHPNQDHNYFHYNNSGNYNHKSSSADHEQDGITDQRNNEDRINAMNEFASVPPFHSTACDSSTLTNSSACQVDDALSDWRLTYSEDAWESWTQQLGLIT